jgi:hypothetical protein
MGFRSRAEVRVIAGGLKSPWWAGAQGYSLAGEDTNVVIPRAISENTEPPYWVQVTVVRA